MSAPGPASSCALAPSKLAAGTPYSTQPPCPFRLTKQRVTAVAEGGQLPPVRYRQLEDAADQGARGAAVRDDHTQPVRRQRRGQFNSSRRGPLPHFCVRLAAAASYVGADPPRGVLLREPLLRLDPGQSLPRTDVDLAQARINGNRKSRFLADQPRAVQRPLQVTADDRRGSERRHRPRSQRSLRAAEVVQRRVELPLNPTARVPRRAAVPQQQQPAVTRRLWR